MTDIHRLRLRQGRQATGASMKPTARRSGNTLPSRLPLWRCVAGANRQEHSGFRVARVRRPYRAQGLSDLPNPAEQQVRGRAVHPGTPFPHGSGGAEPLRAPFGPGSRQARHPPRRRPWPECLQGARQGTESGDSSCRAERLCPGELETRAPAVPHRCTAPPQSAPRRSPPPCRRETLSTPSRQPAVPESTPGCTAVPTWRRQHRPSLALPVRTTGGPRPQQVAS